MASRPKRQCVSAREEQAVLEKLCEDFEEEDKWFLGREFVSDDKNDSDLEESDSDSDQDGSDSAQNTESMEMEQLQRKQKFKNLDDVLDENQCAELPPQLDRTFISSDAKKTYNV